MKNNAIDIRKLTKSYGKSRGINELELTVSEGDFFGFIGPNGAGKSTTIRTLLGLISPTSGKASVLGYDIVTEKEKILREVGYLPSEINFYNGMKVKDVIRYSADLRRTDCKKKAKDLSERLGLDLNKKVEELSLGNRKKVGIVCAIQHSPKLLILDEPTSGLDPLMQREFFNILKEENEEGSTIFFSSHILSEVQNYCRSAAFIKDGRIIIVSDCILLCTNDIFVDVGQLVLDHVRSLCSRNRLVNDGCKHIAGKICNVVQNVRIHLGRQVIHEHGSCIHIAYHEEPSIELERSRCD